jgi:hypothetical protein
MLPKEIENIIFNMKKEIEDTEKVEEKLYSIANRTDITHVFTSLENFVKENGSSVYIPSERIQVRRIPPVTGADLPFHIRHFTMKWAEYTRMSESRIDYIYMNLNVNNKYKKDKSLYSIDDLIYLMDTFSYLPLLSQLFLDDWDKVCKTKEDFEKISISIKKFVSNKNRNLLFVFYMKEDIFNEYLSSFVNLNPKVEFRHKDRDWD